MRKGPAKGPFRYPATQPLELLDRLAALVPPPSRHRHHCAGVFVPHARYALASPPDLEAEGIGTAVFEFDQSPRWDPITPPPDPGHRFDQTLD